MNMHTKLLITFVASLCLCTLGACAPTGTTSVSGSEGGSQENASESLEWDSDSACETCHSDQAESMTNPACLVSSHPDNKCIDCHAVDDALTSVHEGVSADDDVPKRLKKTKVDESQCETCHSAEEIAAATADTTVLTDSNQTVVNPHDLPDVADHDEIQCADCHTFHEEGGLDLTDDNAKRLCGSCHHANVYECHTCHE